MNVRLRLIIFGVLSLLAGAYVAVRLEVRTSIVDFLPEDRAVAAAADRA